METQRYYSLKYKKLLTKTKINKQPKATHLATIEIFEKSIILF